MWGVLYCRSEQQRSRRVLRHEEGGWKIRGIGRDVARILVSLHRFEEVCDHMFHLDPSAGHPKCSEYLLEKCDAICQSGIQPTETYEFM
jgi:hypothetical protein